jgi:hypothetical protein
LCGGVLIAGHRDRCQASSIDAAAGEGEAPTRSPILDQTLECLWVRARRRPVGVVALDTLVVKRIQLLEIGGPSSRSSHFSSELDSAD